MSGGSFVGGDGGIVPALIPGDKLDSGVVRGVAGELTGLGVQVCGLVVEALKGWAGLPDGLSGPGLDVLYPGLDAPAAELRDMAGRFGSAGVALSIFANVIDELKPQFVQARIDAEGVRKLLDAGEMVPVYEDSTSGDTPVSSQVGEKWIPWTDSAGLRALNDAMVSQVNALYSALVDGEAVCANKLNSLLLYSSAGPLPVLTGTDLVGYMQAGGLMPWGAVSPPAQPTEPPNYALHFLYGVWDCAYGLESMVPSLLGFNLSFLAPPPPPGVEPPPPTKVWSLKNAGAAWGGLLKLAASVAVVSYPPATLAGLIPDKKGGSITGKAFQQNVDMVKGMVAWDMWKTDPMRAFGYTSSSLVLMLVGGGEGAAAAGMADGVGADVAGAAAKSIAEGAGKAAAGGMGRAAGDVVVADTVDSVTSRLARSINDGTPGTPRPGEPTTPTLNPAATVPHPNPTPEPPLNLGPRGDLPKIDPTTPPHPTSNTLTDNLGPAGHPEPPAPHPKPQHEPAEPPAKPPADPVPPKPVSDPATPKPSTEPTPLKPTVSEPPTPKLDPEPPAAITKRTGSDPAATDRPPGQRNQTSPDPDTTPAQADKTTTQTEPPDPAHTTPETEPPTTGKTATEPSDKPPNNSQPQPQQAAPDPQAPEPGRTTKPDTTPTAETTPGKIEPPNNTPGLDQPGTPERMVPDSSTTPAKPVKSDTQSIGNGPESGNPTGTDIGASKGIDDPSSYKVRHHDDTVPSDGSSLEPGQVHTTARGQKIVHWTDDQQVRLDDLAATPGSPIVKIGDEYILRLEADIPFDADAYFAKKGIDPDSIYKGDMTWRDEYNRQLQLQQAGMNSLTIGEWLQNVRDFTKRGRIMHGEQADAREDFLAGRSATEPIPPGPEDALHGPDQFPGGRPNRFDGLGDKGINRSIGSRWKTRRQVITDSLDGILDEIAPDLRNFVHMNVRLHY